MVVKVAINKPFAHWKSAFDAHADTRKSLGIHDVFCAPVIGEQAILYGVTTDRPREILDMMYETEARRFIEASGHEFGTEVFTLCEIVS